MNILIINAGSSSLKYQLIDMNTESVLAKGLAERIGIEGANLKHQANGKTIESYKTMKNHIEAMKVVLSALVDPISGAISDMSEIHAVGHRVVHGGEKFAQSVIIDDNVIAAIEESAPLAPLHNPPNLMGINACRAVMPNTPMVGVFDTAFHQTMPERAFLYGVPMDYYRRLKVRRYGFHGTSHRFVTEATAAYLGKPASELKLIICHLGNGSSITAVDGGISVDTSMGLTPLEGVIMGTRSGSIDPAIIEYVMKLDNQTIDQVMATLNKKSGLLGLSCRSSDMRDVRAAKAEGSDSAAMALDVWGYSIKKYIGAYAAVMNGLDALVFTAGIGENVADARREVAGDMEFLGICLDYAKNETHKGTGCISTADSRVKVLVIPTDEEMAIARDTLALVEGQ